MAAATLPEWKISEDEKSITWEITGFNEIKNKDMIFSEPFFTPPNGYKIRLIMFPNGYNKAKNKYMSLYFQILRGDHDNKLSWPLEKEVALAITNQKSTTPDDHCYYTFGHRYTLNRDRDVFEKPGEDGNCTFGMEAFIHLNELKNDKFVNNDRMLIKFSFF